MTADRRVSFVARAWRRASFRSTCRDKGRSNCRRTQYVSPVPVVERDCCWRRRRRRWVVSCRCVCAVSEESPRAVFICSGVAGDAGRETGLVAHSTALRNEGFAAAPRACLPDRDRCPFTCGHCGVLADTTGRIEVDGCEKADSGTRRRQRRLRPVLTENRATHRNTDGSNAIPTITTVNTTPR